MSRDEIGIHIEKKTIPKLPPLARHSQYVEPSVMLVSEASRTVHGFDNRQKSVLTEM